MPLPETARSLDLPWPPAELAKVTPKLQEWSSWYSGDVRELELQYGHQGAVAPATRPSQLSGGVRGSVARWFWGSPVAVGQPRAKLHVPVASDIATASADLLFSEAVAIGYPDEVPDTARDRLQLILDRNNWDSLLLEAAEVNAALGGIYLRATWDKEVEPDCPIITAVHADAAWPEFQWGRLRAVTFWRKVDEQGETVLRHLERHEPGRIEHGLYQGTRDKLGRRVPLTDSRATAGITVDDQAGISTGFEGLTAVHVPNMRPNRAWRSDPLGSNLGRSDFAGVEPLMDAVDETWTSWMRDIRLGKGRVIVPNYMLAPGGPGRPSTFNVDQEVFVGLGMAPSEDPGSTGSTMSVQQFQIRTEEHAGTLKGLLSQIFRGAGYSGQTFGIADEATATATEVHARERRSITTREKKTRYYVDGLARFLEAVMAVDRAQFRGGIEPFRPELEFPPAAAPSQQEIATTVQMFHAAEAISTHERVVMVHPDWDDKQIKAEVELILKESAAKVPDFGPLPGDGNEDGEDPAAQGDIPPDPGENLPPA